MKQKNTAPPAAPLPISSRHANVIAGLLIACFGLQALWHARVKTTTYDEGGHLAISYLMSETGRLDFDTSHPTLLRYLFSLPLRFIGASLPSGIPAPVVEPATPMRERPSPLLYQYAAFFLFRNSIPAESILFWSRATTIALGCLLGWVIFLWARKLYGDSGAILSVLFFSFCPNLIAHFSLATTDAGGTASAVFFLYALFNLMEKPSRLRSIACGAALGLALLCKFTNLFLVIIFLILYPAIEALQKRGLKSILLTMLDVAGTSWLVVCAGYRFEGVFVSHALPAQDWLDLKFGPAIQNLIRWAPLPQNFMHGILYILHHSDRGHSAFLQGQYSAQGWWYYFPFAFLVKTPTAALVAIAAFAALLAARKIGVSRREAGILLLAAIVLWSGISAHLNIGIRHILLIYPLIYILLGQLAKAIPQGKTAGVLIAAGILLSGETLMSAPNYLAFFNRPSGGPERGIERLSDSNIDWGQDLNGLAAFIRNEGNPELVMSYFGTAAPPYFGLQYQGLPSAWTFPPSDHVNSANPAKEYLAVSVTNLQGTYFVAHDLFAWLTKKKPATVIGYSIYVYDITDDLESQERILDIYRRMGRTDIYPRMEERIRLLKKKLGV